MMAEQQNLFVQPAPPPKRWFYIGLGVAVLVIAVVLGVWAYSKSSDASDAAPKFSKSEAMLAQNFTRAAAAASAVRQAAANANAAATQTATQTATETTRRKTKNISDEKWNKFKDKLPPGVQKKLNACPNLKVEDRSLIMRRVLNRILTETGNALQIPIGNDGKPDPKTVLRQLKSTGTAETVDAASELFLMQMHTIQEEERGEPATDILEYNPETKMVQVKGTLKAEIDRNLMGMTLNTEAPMKIEQLVLAIAFILKANREKDKISVPLDFDACSICDPTCGNKIVDSS